MSLRLRTATAAATGTALLALLGAATAGAVPTVRTLDGPSADARTGEGVDVAADASGALVYLKAVGGVNHVFASRLAAGAWGAPEQVDTGAAEAAARPKVAAYPGGGIVVTWLSGAAAPYKLRSAIATGGGQPFVPQDVVATAAVSAQDLDVAADGTGYVSFTTGNDVRAARLAGGAWTPIGGPVGDPAGILDRTAAEEAAAPGGMKESDIAAHPGGAVMTWTESDGAATDIIARRLTGATAGPATELSVDTFDGAARGGLTDMTDIAIADDGTAHVAFRESLVYGITEKPRVLVRRLPVAGAPDAPQVVDGLPAVPPEGAEYPGLAVSRNGQHGLVGTPRQLFFETFGARLGGATWTAGARVDTGTPTAASTPIAAVGDSGFGAIAWYDKEGAEESVQAVSGGGTAVPGGTPEVLSVPGAGPITFNDTQTVTAAADRDGNTHVLFAQGAPAARRIVIATIPTTVPLTQPTTPTTPTPTPTTPTTPQGTPGRQSFGRTVLLSTPATLKRSGRRLAIRLRNREPFTVRAAITVRTVRRKGRPVRTLARTSATLQAGQTRTLRPSLLTRAARLAAPKGTRVTLRITLRAPKGAARTISRTVRIG